MSRLSRVLFAFFLFGSFAITGCGDDEDSIPPVIDVILPIDGNFFNVLDIIPVVANVSDETTLESVSIQLVEAGLQPVLSTINIQPDDREVSISRNYELDDIGIPSGEYFIRIVASDGVNETQSLVRVTLNEVPQKREGLFLVSGDNGNGVNISMLDEAGNIGSFHSMGGDYQGCGVSSRNRYINVIGRFENDMISFDVDDGAERWRVDQEPSFPHPFFEHMGYYNEVSYVCRHDGQILGYAENGGLSFSAETELEFFPQKSFLHEELLFVQEAKRVGSGNQLTGYLLSTGFRWSRVPIDFDIAATRTLNANELFLFVNDNGQGRILLYDINGTSYWETQQMPPGRILDVEQISNGVYLIAHEQLVLIYDHFNGTTLISYLQEPGVQQLTYDPLSDELFVAHNNVLDVYDYSEKSLKAVYQHNFVIDGLHLLYNK